MTKLTPRQGELADLLHSPMDLKNIACQMNVQASSVKVSASLLYRKLAVSGRVEMMAREIDRLRKLQHY
jgi:DNA-binding NarL/FixJ family response regulator